MSDLRVLFVLKESNTACLGERFKGLVCPQGRQHGLSLSDLRVLFVLKACLGERFEGRVCPQGRQHGLSESR